MEIMSEQQQKQQPNKVDLIYDKLNSLADDIGSMKTDIKEIKETHLLHPDNGVYSRIKTQKSEIEVLKKEISKVRQTRTKTIWLVVSSLTGGIITAFISLFLV
jgi:archaellum component FlaC